MGTKLFQCRLLKRLSFLIELPFTFVKNWLRILVGHVWILSSVSFIYVSFLLSIPQGLDYCSCRTCFKFSKLIFPLCTYFLNDFAILIFLPCYIDFMINLPKTYPRTCVKFAYQFGENQHLYYFECSNPWTQNVSPFIYILYFLHQPHIVCHIQVLNKGR